MIPFNKEIRENKAPFVKALHPSKNIIFGFFAGETQVSPRSVLHYC
jgi:hypothetical protein